MRGEKVPLIDNAKLFTVFTYHFSNFISHISYLTYQPSLSLSFVICAV